MISRCGKDGIDTRMVVRAVKLVKLHGSVRTFLNEYD